MKKQFLMQGVLSLVIASSLLLHHSASAQTKTSLSSTIGQTVTFEVSAPNGTTLNMANYKGKVVLVFHWSTNCSICLDKMVELRNNTAGWLSQPFVLIAVNHDLKKQDYQDYIRILSIFKTAPSQMQFAYHKDVLQDSLFKSNVSLPQTYLIDSQGTLRYVFNGRIAPQAWDLIAEMLP